MSLQQAITAILRWSNWIFYSQNGRQVNFLFSNFFIWHFLHWQTNFIIQRSWNNLNDWPKNFTIKEKSWILIYEDILSNIYTLLTLKKIITKIWKLRKKSSIVSRLKNLKFSIEDRIELYIRVAYIWRCVRKLRYKSRVRLLTGQKYFSNIHYHAYTRQFIAGNWNFNWKQKILVVHVV